MKVILVPPPFTINDGKISSTHSYAELYDPRVNPSQQIHAHQSNPDYVMIDGIMHTVHKGSPPVFNHSTSYANKNFEYDPLTDYWKWYTGNTYVSYDALINITPYEIPQKCWAHNELNEWLNENLSRPVLVQNTSSMWKLCFVASIDKVNFENWWRYKQKSYSMWLSVDKDERDMLPVLEAEVNLWCKTHLTGSWSIDRAHDRLKVSVKDTDEAVMFKLAFNPKDTWV